MIDAIEPAVRDPAIEPLRENTMLGAEERPIEMGEAGRAAEGFCTSVALEDRLRLRGERVEGAAEVLGLTMQIACACASDSTISSMPMAHSWFIMVLVTPCANIGSVGEERAMALRLRLAPRWDACRPLKKPQRWPSSAVIARPVNSSSAARPWPITRGSSPHAPMSAPARPDTREQEGRAAPAGVA